MPDDDVKKLRGWLLNFVDKFREEYSKLAPYEKSSVPNSDDYTSPCQIEVFWMKEPEYQLIFTSHFENELDLDIRIHGPYDAGEFLKKLIDVLKEPRWQREIPPDDTHLFEAHYKKLSYAEAFAYPFGYNFFNSVTNSIFREKHDWPWGHGMAFTNNEWAQILRGNLSQLDYNERVKMIINQTIHNATLHRREAESGKKSQAQIERPQRPQATYFYPPIWIGKMPEPTLNQRLMGASPFPLMAEKAFATKFDNMRLIVNRDGFMVLDNYDKMRTMQVFNVIAGTCILHRIKAHAVRVSDVGEADFDDDGMIVGWTIPTALTQKIKTATESWLSIEEFRKPLAEEQLRRIIEKADQLYKEEEVASKLELLAQSNTHFNSENLAESFILSWLIIEKHLNAMYGDAIKNKRFKSKRDGKKDGFLHVGVIINELYKHRIIPKREHKLLVKLKDTRNRYVHDGIPVNKKYAKRCLNHAITIVRQIAL